MSDVDEYELATIKLNIADRWKRRGSDLLLDLTGNMLVFVVQRYFNTSKAACRCVIVANLNDIWVLYAGGQLSECQHGVATLIDLPEMMSDSRIR